MQNELIKKWLDRSKEVLVKTTEDVSTKVKNVDWMAVRADAEKYAGMAKDGINKTYGMIKEQVDKAAQKKAAAKGEAKTEAKAADKAETPSASSKGEDKSE